MKHTCTTQWQTYLEVRFNHPQLREQAFVVYNTSGVCVTIYCVASVSALVLGRVISYPIQLLSYPFVRIVSVIFASISWAFIAE